MKWLMKLFNRSKDYHKIKRFLMNRSESKYIRWDMRNGILRLNSLSIEDVTNVFSFDFDLNVTFEILTRINKSQKLRENLDLSLIFDKDEYDTPLWFLGISDISEILDFIETFNNKDYVPYIKGMSTFDHDNSFFRIKNAYQSGDYNFKNVEAKYIVKDNPIATYYAFDLKVEAKYFDENVKDEILTRRLANLIHYVPLDESDKVLLKKCGPDHLTCIHKAALDGLNYKKLLNPDYSKSLYTQIYKELVKEKAKDVVGNNEVQQLNG